MDAFKTPNNCMSACGQFFSIFELVSLFLCQAETPVLLNCQRVCRGWREIIQGSHEMQENLFMQPMTRSETTDITVALNPILSTHFAQVFGQAVSWSRPDRQYAIFAPECEYFDLAGLPWARDGTHASARARIAFARKEASWRRMLLTQPPVQWVDWWHEWECSDRRGIEGYPDSPLRHGRGHHQDRSKQLTIGLLWDMVEALLLRHSRIRVTFFPAGESAGNDASASEQERTWQRSSEVAEAGFSTTLPRVRVCSRQIWPGEGPAMFQRFNVPQGVWEIQDELHFTPESDRDLRRYEFYDGDGTYWLKQDCCHDMEETNWRWSRSDDCNGPTIQRISTSMSGGESKRSERVRERARRRRAAYDSLIE